MQSVQHSRIPVYPEEGTDNYMGSFNFSWCILWKQTKKAKQQKFKCVQCAARTNSVPSRHVWVHVCLLGGSVLPPPEHIVAPRTASHPLSAAATFFPAWPSTPSQHQMCLRPADPFSFLLLSQAYAEMCRQQGLSTAASPLSFASPSVRGSPAAADIDSKC